MGSEISQAAGRGVTGRHATRVLDDLPSELVVVCYLDGDFEDPEAIEPEITDSGFERIVLVVRGGEQDDVRVKAAGPADMIPVLPPRLPADELLDAAAAAADLTS